MFKLEIKTGGSAFRDESQVDRSGDFALDRYGSEVRRILKDVIRKLDEGHSCGKIMDVNGNCVGRWSHE